MPQYTAASINSSFTSLGMALGGSAAQGAPGPPQRGTMLLSWGSNSKGQLGLGHNKDTILPTLVQPLSHRKIFHVRVMLFFSYAW